MRESRERQVALDLGTNVEDQMMLTPIESEVSPTRMMNLFVHFFYGYGLIIPLGFSSMLINYFGYLF